MEENNELKQLTKEQQTQTIDKSIIHRPSLFSQTYFQNKAVHLPIPPNDIKNNTNDIFFNSTYNGSYNNNYVKNININNDYFKEIDQEQFTRDSTIKKNNFSLNRNYFENKENFSLNRNNINNININNINSYNSLINDNKVNINQKKIIINNMNNYNGQNKIIMNKSSSNFYPRISINSSEEEKKEENNSNTIRNFNLENGFKYNNNNDF